MQNHCKILQYTLIKYCVKVCLTNKNLKNKLNISEQDMVAITNILREKYPTTVWGYTNAITEFSKTKGFERRFELERLAGDLLHDPELYALVV